MDGEVEEDMVIDFRQGETSLSGEKVGKECAHACGMLTINMCYMLSLKKIIFFKGNSVSQRTRFLVLFFCAIISLYLFPLSSFAPSHRGRWTICLLLIYSARAGGKKEKKRKKKIFIFGEREKKKEAKYCSINSNRILFFFFFQVRSTKREKRGEESNCGMRAK